jgi:hypothetical protein
MGFDRRIARLEERTSDGNACVRVIPLDLKPGETREEAIARQKRKLRIAGDHGCLVVTWMSVDEECPPTATA